MAVDDAAHLADGGAGTALADEPPGSAHSSRPPLGTTAVRVDTGRLDVGQFVVAAPPSAEHIKGTLATVGSEYTPEEVRESYEGAAVGKLYVVEIDLATASEIARLPLGTARPAGLVTTPSGLVVAVEGAHELSLVWLEGARSVREVHAVPELGSSTGFELSGFAAVSDRLVVIDGGGNGSSTRAFVLDAHGALVAKHTCPGGLPRPSPPPHVEAWGNRAVLTDLTAEREKPICAFGLDRGARTQTATFPVGSGLSVEGGRLYVSQLGPRDWEFRRVGDDLHTTAPVVPDPRPTGSPVDRCRGITGTATWQSDVIEGLVVARTISCCGDRAPAGIFVCDPNAPP